MSANETNIEKKTLRSVKGIVTSDRMNKTRVCVVERKLKHPLLGKFIKKSTKFMFHDEKNESKTGDEVLIVPSKPRSVRKSYELLKIVTR